MKRLAFTLIELMVVMAIIAVLAGLILAVTGPLRAQAAGQRTATTIHTVIQALTLATSSRSGGSIEPAEHPLAGSAPTRPAFIRTSGEAVAVSGEALRGVPAAGLSDPPAVDRLLLHTDHFAEQGVPVLYGMQRRALGILGAPRSEVTAYRQLVAPRSGAAIPSTSGFTVAATADTAAHDRLIASLLGASAAKELTNQQALWAPPDDAPANLAWNGRVWAGPVASTSSRPCSRFRDPADGSWKIYRVRGLGLYDAWGRELLIESMPGGSMRVGSPGRDGYFRFRPATPEGGFATAANAASASGGDADAQQDNIWSQAEVR